MRSETRLNYHGLPIGGVWWFVAWYDEVKRGGGEQGLGGMISGVRRQEKGKASWISGK
jgi:hypothetical protein